MWRLIRAIIVIVLVLLALPYVLVPFYRTGHPVSIRPPGPTIACRSVFRLEPTRRGCGR